MRKNIAPQANVIDGFYDSTTGAIRMQLDMPLKREGTTNCAVVMDASGSMDAHYRRPPFGKASDVENFVRQAGAFIANYDSDKGVQVYLCCLGNEGKGVKDLGNFPQAGLESLKIDKPDLGSGTYLAPALQRVVKEIVVDANATYGFIVLLTDGVIHDFDDIKMWIVAMARQIEAKQHASFKIVLVGFDDADKRQMETLDNLDTGTSVDIFNALFVFELSGVMDALDSEAVNNEFSVCSAGYLEVNGQAVTQFERGVPQRIDATIPTDCPRVTVVLKEGNDEQRIEVELPA